MNNKCYRLSESVIWSRTCIVCYSIDRWCILHDTPLITWKRQVLASTGPFFTISFFFFFTSKINKSFLEFVAASEEIKL